MSIGMFSLQVVLALLVSIVVAGYALAPLEKKSDPTSPLRHARWLLLIVFLFLTYPLLLDKYSFFYTGIFLLFLGIAIVKRFTRVPKEKRFEVTTATISNIVLLYLACYVLPLFLFLVLFSVSM